MHCTFDLIMCPVRSWSKIVQRILKYPGINSDTPINIFYCGRILFELRSDDVRKATRAVAFSIGEHKLGFHPDEIGSYSLRSEAAMSVYFYGILVYTMILIKC